MTHPHILGIPILLRLHQHIMWKTKTKNQDIYHLNKQYLLMVYSVPGLVLKPWDYSRKQNKGPTFMEQ